MERAILHSDLNNFYASVECSLNPKLRGHPVAVAGDPEARHGIILAKNYEAKRCGIATGEALWEAKLKCPDIIFVPPHYDKYMEISNRVREIYGEYTDMVEPFGLDECWLDVTASRRLFGGGETIANEIRERIKKEMDITVSVGVSFNKIFAKLGSDMKKPDATTVIDKEHFKEKIWGLCASELLFVGRSTFNKLKQYNIKTIGDVAKADLTLLQYLLGKNGIMLHRFANGLDTSPVSNIAAKSLVKSVSCGTTTPRDMVTDNDIRVLLCALSQKVSTRLRDLGFVCRTVQLQIRDYDLSSIVRQQKLSYPGRTADEIFKAAYNLFLKNHKAGKPVRSMSIGACDLDYREFEQLSLEEELYKKQRMETLEDAMDKINSRFGEGTVHRALTMTAPELCNITLKNEPGILPGLPLIEM